MRNHHHEHPARHRFHHPTEGFDGPGDGPHPQAGPGWAGHGPGHGPGRGPGRGRRGRAPRGDVRLAILTLLADRPMHGYELMQAIAERTSGRWSPSPGAIYPAINQLEDEGLVTVAAEHGRKVVALTDAGRDALGATGGSDPFAASRGDSDRPDLRDLVEQLHGAVRQVARTGSDAQVVSAAAVLAEARRSLYLLLAEGPDSPTR